MGKILTVSIAAYNMEKYLQSTLDSLLNKKVLDSMEIIVVNDGSKDSTALIAQEYARRYPDSFILIDKENGGYGSTINASLKIATGKYFKLLDSDDWFETDMLEYFIDRLKETDADLVFNQSTLVYADDNYREKAESTFCPYNCVLNIADMAPQIPSLNISMFTVKTKLLQENNISFTEKCFYVDVEFFCKSFEVAETYISLPINMYRYRKGREGQSTLNILSFINNIDDYIKISKFRINSLKKNGSKLKHAENLINSGTQNLIHVLTLLPPSKESRDKFVDFMDFFKATDPERFSKQNSIIKLIYRMPALLYNPFVKIRRKKNNVK